MHEKQTIKNKMHLPKCAQQIYPSNNLQQPWYERKYNVDQITNYFKTRQIYQYTYTTGQQ